MGGAISGIMNVVKGVVDAVAPIASLIPGVGMFAMAAKAAVDIGGGIVGAMSKKAQQDQEDEQTNDAAAKTANAFAGDLAGGIGKAVSGAAEGILSGGIGGLLGGL
ncbi:MAG: hypothetical protein JWM80_3784 [Cyanobacteria bacterium RYN_339]|nr:hypothetical protein [Cyanobacteria bacterium RYN_339]